MLPSSIKNLNLKYTIISLLDKKLELKFDNKSDMEADKK